MAGDQGRDEARRRFGARARDLAPEKPLSEREFTFDDVLDTGGRGLARAAALHGNASAKRALAELARAVDQINRNLPDDYQPPDIASGQHPWGSYEPDGAA